MNYDPNNPLVKGVLACRNMTGLIRFISALREQRAPVKFGVEKQPGKSYESLRKAANQAAIELLNNLQPGQKLTDDQRQTLAGYTGQGGIGGTESEYYTPQPIAEGVWDILKMYGADTGNVLEPSSGVGVFHETKPRGVLMTATEIDTVSGTINQLLHPEDSVTISPFEQLASTSPDGTFDHCVGNVPFGNNRGAFANIDPAYAGERNIGRYFVLRLLDKIKPGGYACIVVPYGMTSGKDMQRLREEISRKAEFLGAHRLPTGTFDESGTSTVVDVQVFRKHPEELADLILQADESLLTAASVLWPTYISGKWFELDGKRFLHGDQQQAFRGIVVKNDQVSNIDLKQKMIHKFESRINWDMLQVEPTPLMRAEEDERRYINRQWYRFSGGEWALDNSVRSQALDKNVYGAATHADLQHLMRTEEGMLSLSWPQMLAVSRDYPQYLSDQAASVMEWADSQKSQHRERLFRGGLVGMRIQTYRDLLTTGHASDDALNRMREDLVSMVNAEAGRFGNPNQGMINRISGNGAGPWFAFKSATSHDGTLSALLQGTIDTSKGHEFNAEDHADTVRHLFSQIDLVPVTVEEFRNAFKGDLPSDDNELLDILAGKDGVAVTPEGNLVPFDRATSGDIGILMAALQGAVANMEDGPQRHNMLSQIQGIRDKRKWTDVDDISFRLNARWFDRSLVLQFLHEQGYEDLIYASSIETDDHGRLTSDINYHGRDGVFTGYRHGTIQGRDKETGLPVSRWGRKSAKSGEEFAPQLEKYLNGQKPTGVNAVKYRENIKVLESQFNDWIRQHDEIDTLVEQYNNAYNSFIPYEQSDAALNLEGISGERTPFGYQNQEVRRLSEDGRGILGFGTGLGKTTTALALEAYNFENGRTKRTAIVVPKSVYENWYHEAKQFYSPAAFANFLFVGLDPVLGAAGETGQVPVLDDNGKPVLNPNSGLPEMRDALKLSDEATIKARMHQIPQSNFRTVVMTKEQYARIPLKKETMENHAQDVLHQMVDAGRLTATPKNHREANQRNRVLDNNSSSGSAKEYDYPYFEDMGFDNVIADEGHNYRNSYSAGREAAQLAYLPIPSVAKSARDMAVKNAWLMAQNNGRGPVLLTATPVVNSPIDAFNMLSHVVSMQEWARMGIHTPDDFVKVFGRTDQVLVQRISGEIEAKEGLVGFENLDGLRGIFHRWTTLKTSADVSNEVKIPELDEHTREAPMSDEQAEHYETLRKRAEDLANGKTDKYHEGENGKIEAPDSIFAIIRDMDRVASDLDLYHRQITFRFPATSIDAVHQLAADLPGSAGESSDEDYSASGTGRVSEKGDFCDLVVPESYEQEVLKRLQKFGISEKSVSHPIPPKYSRLIEHVREGLKSGKQIIFTDEKSQHGKLKRILCAALDMTPDQIGILNATTVADAGKKGKKPKVVKQPKPLPDEPSDDQLQTYYQQQQAYDDYVASVNEVSLGGLEQIASDYQEGRTPIIICNKKAEVGNNLHKGTSDIHHLTLPWTPASIDQRNGRGARVGSTHSRVRVHYYCGKGSFDEFRLKTLKRKKDWIREILTSDTARMDNADADNVLEMQLLLASDPQERERMLREQQNAAKAAQLEAAKSRARINLTNYMKAMHSGAGNLEADKRTLESLQNNLARQQAEIDEARAEIIKYTELLNDAQKDLDTANKYQLQRFAQRLREENKKLDEGLSNYRKARSRLNIQERRIKRANDADKKIRQLRPLVADAIKKGLLEVDPDVVDHGDKMILDGDRVFKVGQVYAVNTGYKSQIFSADEKAGYAEIASLDFDLKTATLRGITSPDNSQTRITSRVVMLSELPPAVDLSQDERRLLTVISGGISMRSIPDVMTKQDFVRLLKSGVLRISDEMALCWLEGKYQMQVLNRRGHGYSDGTYRDGAWYAKYAENLVFPDRGSNALKTAVAKFFRAADYSEGSGVRPFMIGMFGEQYVAAIASIGETAQQDVIDSTVAEWLARVEKDCRDRRKSMYGGTPQDVSYWRDTGKYLTDTLKDGNFSTARLEVPPQYINRDDFQKAAMAALVPVMDLARNNTDAAVRAYAQEQFEDVQSAVAAGKPYQVNSMEAAIRGGNDLASAYRTSRPGSVNLVAFLTDAVLAGLVDINQISAADMLQSFENNPYIVKAQHALNALSNADRQALHDKWGLLTGTITQEEIAARNAKIVEKEKNRDNYDVRLQHLGITSRVNSSTIRLMWKRRNMGSFDAGKARGFFDPAGKDGKLFAAKNELKEKFNAKFQGGGAEDSDFPGSWWLISSDIDLGDVLNVIENA